MVENEKLYGILLVLFSSGQLSADSKLQQLNLNPFI